MGLSQGPSSRRVELAGVRSSETGFPNGADILILSDLSFYIDERSSSKYLPGAPHNLGAALPTVSAMGSPALLGSSAPTWTRKGIKAYCLSLALESHFVFCVGLQGQQLSCCCWNSPVADERPIPTLTLHCFPEYPGRIGLQANWGSSVGHSGVGANN